VNTVINFGVPKNFRKFLVAPQLADSREEFSCLKLEEKYSRMAYCIRVVRLVREIEHPPKQELAGETEMFREHSLQFHFVHHNPPHHLE
jgi:hypothetical protein